MAKLRLVIGIPSGPTWSADFGMCLAMMVAQLSHPVPGFKEQQFRVHNKKSSILANSRQQMVEECLRNGATHLLFIDSDQTFPADLVHRLMAHGKQVVACNVATKMLPSTPTARLAPDRPLYTLPDSTGLVEVWRVGTGVMLIDLAIFRREKLREGPWFSQRWDPEIGMYVGEDWAFCERLEEAGVRIWVDQDLSKEIGHVGTLSYGHDLVGVPDGAVCSSAA